MTGSAAQTASSGATISVVIPVYNGEQYLARCLDSVLASTFPDLEIICIDDGSSDGSLSILHAYAKNDPRFRILTQDHKYAGAARNAGIAAATGKYIHFLDADDEIIPSAYETWVRAADAAGADVCECLYTNIHAENGTAISQGAYKPYDETLPLTLDSSEQNAISILRGDVVPWNKLYLRRFLTEKNLQFDNLICAEDRSFYFALIFQAPKLIRLPDRFVHHRLGIGTSLDGSDIRFRCFDVEFRSFERIWELAKDRSVFVKRQILDCCIGDSFSYYGRAIGTAYEEPIRRQLCDYWPPYLPFLGEAFYRNSWWYGLFQSSMLAEDRWIWRFLLSLYRLRQRLARSKGLLSRCLFFIVRVLFRILRRLAITLC